MKTVIYVWKNNSIHNKKCNDIFQLVKSTCFLFHLSRTMYFDLIVDISHHSISKYLQVQSHKYQQLITDNINTIPVVHDPEEYIKSSNSKIIFFRSFTYVLCKLSQEYYHFIQSILVPSSVIIRRIETIQVCNIVHVHINKSIIGASTYQHLFHSVYTKIKPYLTPTTILLSDTKEFKSYVKNLDTCIVFDTLIGNIGHTPHDYAVEDTMFDLFLMTKACKIYSYSWDKTTTPGFVNIMYLYDIPIYKIN